MAVYTDKLIIDGQDISIAIEVEDTNVVDSLDGNIRGAKKVIETVHDLFGEGMLLARNCALRVVQSINEMHKSVKPDEFQLQFSIKLDTAVGAMIAKAEAGAQMQITMTWKNNKNS